MSEVAKNILTDEEVEFVSRPSGWLYATSIEPVAFYPTQRVWMDGVPGNILELTRKSRRVGYTYAKAQGAVALAHTHPGSTVIFTSMNLQEAYDKIEVARQAYYAAHPDVRRPLVTETKTMLEFAHDSRTVSRIVCMFKPRGQKGRGIFVCIDEFNYILNQEEVLTAAIPNIQHGGRISVGGSVHSGSQFFDEMWDGTFKEGLDDELRSLLTDAVVRIEVPWWRCPYLVGEKWVTRMKEVNERAQRMGTRERVMTFGSQRLKMIYAVSYEDHFLQEYELVPIADGASVIPWEVILRCTPTGSRLEEGGPYPPEVAVLRRGRLRSFGDAVRLAEQVGGRLWLGYDVGRKRNASELTVLLELPSVGVLFECFYETSLNVPYDTQKGVLASYLELARQATLTIDATQAGGAVSEDLKRRFRRRVLEVEFQNYNKLQMFDRLLVRMQRGGLVMCADRSRMDQLCSVKRRVSEAGNVVYYVPRKERHHADKAVSLALGVYGRDGGSAVEGRGRIKVSGRREVLGARADELTPRRGELQSDLATLSY